MAYSWLAKVAGVVLFALSVLSPAAGSDKHYARTKQVATSNPVAAGDISFEIKSDETVIFFPTYAHFDENTKTWTLPIHGHIFEPEGNSIRRRAMLKTLAKTLDVESGSAGEKVLRRRLKLFLVDNERGKQIFVRMGSKVYAAGTSDPNGHFGKDLRLPTAELERLLSMEGRKNAKQAVPKRANGWIGYRAVLDKSDKRTFEGRMQAVGREGISVISDIDDTIKHSQVTDREALLANTFLRRFEPVPGMAELYRDWSQKGVVFHYVSGSPWQLYTPLARFMADEHFPAGSFALKKFRLKDPSSLGLLQSQETHKLAAIEPIMKAFPHRRFILIGDSGEQDPEIYATLARKHPRQVAAIFIRNVTAAKPNDARFKAVRKDLGNVRFVLFDDAREIECSYHLNTVLSQES